MKRRVIGLFAALALALSIAAPASASVHSATLYTGADGTGSSLTITASTPNLPYGFNDTASSASFALAAGECVKLYDGTLWQGRTVWSVFGPQDGGVVDVPAALDNAISSVKFGVTYNQGGGNLVCLG